MFGDDAFFENDSVTAVLKHRACHESDGKKKNPNNSQNPLEFFNAHWVNYKKKKVFRKYSSITEK